MNKKKKIFKYNTKNLFSIKHNTMLLAIILHTETVDTTNKQIRRKIYLEYLMMYFSEKVLGVKANVCVKNIVIFCFI